VDLERIAAANPLPALRTDFPVSAAAAGSSSKSLGLAPLSRSGSAGAAGTAARTRGEDLAHGDSRNGTLYYLTRGRDGDRPWDVHRGERLESGYAEPERLGAAVNTPFVDGFPFVARDESFLIFYSERPGGFFEGGELHATGTPRASGPRPSTWDPPSI